VLNNCGWEVNIRSSKTMALSPLHKIQCISCCVSKISCEHLRLVCTPFTGYKNV